MLPTTLLHGGRYEPLLSFLWIYIENCFKYYFDGIRVVPHFSQSVNQKEFIGREFDKPLKGGICDILLPLMITLDKVVLIKKKRSKTFLHKSRLNVYHNIPIWERLTWKTSHQSVKGKWGKGVAKNMGRLWWWRWWFLSHHISLVGGQN